MLPLCIHRRHALFGAEWGDDATSLHAQCAFKVVVPMEGELVIALDQQPEVRTRNAVVIPPGTEYAASVRGAFAAAYLDVATDGGVHGWGGGPLVVASASATEAAQRLLRGCGPLPGADEVEALVSELFAALAPGGLRQGPADARLLAVLEALDQASDPVALDEVASRVNLSPSRLRHLFAEQLGVPFRRYALWKRLVGALRLLGTTTNLARLSAAAGFADQAHLARTSREMLGKSPSEVLRLFGRAPAASAVPRARAA